MVFLHPHKCGIRICFGVAVPVCSHDLQGLLIVFPTLAQDIKSFPLLLRFTFPVAAALDKDDLRFLFFQSLFQAAEPFQAGLSIDLLLHLGKLFFHVLPPAERIPPRTTFQLGSIHEDRLVIGFSQLLQQPDILVEQIFHRFPAAPGTEPCKGAMIRHRFIASQPYEVYPVPAGLLQFPAGVDPALVSICHDLKHHPRIGCGFPSSGRIRFIQFPVIQFLKLRAC